MTCDKILLNLQRTGGRVLAVEPEVKAHLRECPACAALLRADADDGSTAAIDAAALDRVLSWLRSDLRPVTPLPPASALVLGFLTVFTLLTLSVLSLTGARDIFTGGGWRDSLPLVLLAGGALALAVALSKEMVPGERVLIGSKRIVATVICSFALSLCLLMPWRVEKEFVAMGWHCAQQGFVYALPATLLVLLIVRRGAILAPGSVGALTGAFSGLAGVAILHFHCTIHNAPHLVVWHAGAPMVCSAAGYLVGRYVEVTLPPLRRYSESDRLQGS